MTQIKFTEGPWEKDARGENLVGKNGKTVNIWGCGLSNAAKDEETVANSTLIKVAPEMYALLERIFNDGGLVYADDYDNVSDLLEKADGER
jgi:hypothetical protein